MKRSTALLSAAAVAGLALFGSGCAVETYPDRYSSVSVYSPGHVVRTLPHGYRTVRYDDSDYYVYNDVYYRPHRRGYVVVDSPTRTTTYRRDTVIRTLPRGYRTIRHGNVDYYHHGDTYYRPHRGGYIRVDRPLSSRTIVGPGYVSHTSPYDDYRTVGYSTGDYYRTSLY